MGATHISTTGMDQPFFHPWVGNRYETGLNGCRLLILGESLYSTDSRDEYPRLAVDIVQRFVNGERFPYYTKLSQIIGAASGSSTLDWHDVAFHEYVQALVGTQARARPSDAMWAEAMKPFTGVIRQLRPHAVLCTGGDLWGALSRFFPRDGKSLPTSSPDIRRWELSDCEPIVATWINHPASFGFRPGDWIARVTSLLAEAFESSQRGRT